MTVSVLPERYILDLLNPYFLGPGQNPGWFVKRSGLGSCIAGVGSMPVLFVSHSSRDNAGVNAIEALAQDQRFHGPVR